MKLIVLRIGSLSDFLHIPPSELMRKDLDELIIDAEVLDEYARFKNKIMAEERRAQNRIQEERQREIEEGTLDMADVNPESLA
jgi:hypothetical protein